MTRERKTSLFLLSRSFSKISLPKCLNSIFDTSNHFSIPLTYRNTQETSASNKEGLRIGLVGWLVGCSVLCSLYISSLFSVISDGATSVTCQRILPEYYITPAVKRKKKEDGNRKRKEFENLRIYLIGPQLLKLWSLVFQLLSTSATATATATAAAAVVVYIMVLINGGEEGGGRRKRGPLLSILVFFCCMVYYIIFLQFSSAKNFLLSRTNQSWSFCNYIRAVAIYRLCTQPNLVKKKSLQIIFTSDPIWIRKSFNTM